MNYYSIIINLSLSSVIVFFIWFLSGLGVRGLLFYLLAIMYMPSFLIVSLFKGPNYAMHFASFNTFIVVSFIFYSLLIALIQVIVYKLKKRKQARIGNS